MYPVGVATSSAVTTATPVTTASASATVPSATSGVSVATGSGIARSISAPSAPRPVVQVSSSSASASTTQRPRLRRNQSRTEAIRNYIKRETAQFFGVDEESEVLEKQRWLDRRRRMASRKYGALLPEHKPPDPDITRDVPDTTETPESLTRQRPRERSQSRLESRSFPPSTIAYLSRTEGVSYPDSGLDEEQTFFERPPPPPPPLPPPPSSQQSQQTSQIDQLPSLGGLVKDEEVGAKIADILDTAQDREGIGSEDLVG
ncbi:rhomboid family member 1 [Lasius niger]|uniref:Rhomboid family member 1 n=1 Tax=Lasius niger TaxID=67767 RepID=A0A0J7KM01_LASNI|nr:rhomboid family member 1 [Lasius niger]